MPEQPELFPHVDWETHRVHPDHHDDWDYGDDHEGHEEEPCPSCGDREEHHGALDCPYGGCEPGEHCPEECPYESGHTDWDRVYPHLPDTMHRGMALRLDHRGDWDPAAPPHRMAHTIVDELRHEGLGTHWTPSENMGHHYAEVQHRSGLHNLHVVLHAARPELDAIEKDPHELLKQDVIGFDQHDDAEIPIERHAHVHLTGVSYRHPGDRAWTRHDFKQPMSHTAAWVEGDGSTDWDRVQPTLPAEVHRGIAINLPGHDPAAPHHQTARNILLALEHGQTGTHWTPDERMGQDYAYEYAEPRHNLAVMLHAKTPHRDHFETEPGALLIGGVHGYEDSHEREVPIRRGAPVHVTGVSWLPLDKANRRENWTRYNLPAPLETIAAAARKPWLPHDRFFGPGRPDLDPRLFDGEHLKPAWRKALLALAAKAFAGYGPSWIAWTNVYLAGSQASHWYGNNDLDVLLGIDYDKFRRTQPRHRQLTDRQIDELLNADAHRLCDPARWFTIGGKHLGPFDSTLYVNADSYDIRKIKPYAAYNLTDDTWAVKPTQVPEDFGPDKLPSADFQYARSLASQVRALRKLPAGQAQALGAALYDRLHGERHDAFSNHGGGLYDVRNVAWKYLTLHPEHPMEHLVGWKRAEEDGSGTPHTAGANAPGSGADVQDDDAMIALVPPRDLAERLAVPKGEPVEQLHVTLAYLSHLDQHDLGRLTGAVSEWASQRRAPVCRVQGAGTFVNDGNHPLWAAVDIPGSSELHGSLVRALKKAGFAPAEDHGFTAHLTLSYNRHHVRFLPKITPESFTAHAVWVCRGGTWRPVPFGGSTVQK